MQDEEKDKKLPCRVKIGGKSGDRPQRKVIRASRSLSSRVKDIHTSTLRETVEPDKSRKPCFFQTPTLGKAPKMNRFITK